MIIIIVIVIAVIAILAAVLIPTFSGVVEKANKSAAYQEAKNLWTEYLSEVDYAAGEIAEEDLVIVVKNGAYVVEVTDGKIASNAKSVGTNKDVASITGNTCKLLAGSQTNDGVFKSTHGAAVDSKCPDCCEAAQ